MNGKQNRSELQTPTTIGAGTKRLTFNERFNNKGGFGIIYKGSYKEDGHKEEKIVAVKEYLPEEYATRSEGTDVVVVPGKEEDFEEGLRRFRREAEILAACKHSNIVSFYDIFEANNTAYIVMEFVEGRDWAQYLRDEGNMQEAELKDILCPLLAALEVVHQKKFVHRDIKPSNIVLRSDDSPVLLDFGSAQPIGKNQKVLVTDHYSPPEQYEEWKDQERCTDIYALGAVCHEALTGDRPQSGNQRDPDKDLGIFTFNKEGESTKFCQAIDKALEIEPDARPQNVEEWRKMMGLSPSEPEREEVPDEETSPGPEQKEAAEKKIMEQPDPAPEQKEAANEVPPTKSLESVPPKPKPFDRLIVACLGGFLLCIIVATIGITAYWGDISKYWAEPPPSPPPGYVASAEKEKELKKFRAEVGKDVEPHPRGEHGGMLHLHITAKLKLPMLTKDLIDEGADVDKKDKAGWTALHYAAVANAAEVVEVLIDGRADFHAKDIGLGQTPLHYAAQFESVEAASALLKKGADVHKRDKGGLTPLHWVRDNAELVKTLLDNNADVHAKTWDGRTPLLLAAWRNASEAVRALLNGGADPNATDNDGNTPLHWVAQHNASEAVEALLNKGADPNATDNDGNTPLRLAVQSKASEAVRALLNGGADPNATDNDGNTLLHTAVQSKASEAVEALLNGGADPNATDKNGLTPLHRAAWYNASEAALVLIAKSADPNATDNDGNTPLHTAAERGFPEVVEKLLQSRFLGKLDIKAKNNDDKTALDLASSPRVKELLKPLFESSEMQ